MQEDRFLEANTKNHDVEHDAKLRPQNFEEYIGQSRVVDNIDLMVKSAIKRIAAMDHVLLFPIIGYVINSW